jgi:hypothetical protein
MFLSAISKLFRTGAPKEGLEVVPVHPKPRYKCPFYGFHSAMGRMLMDQRGNECASFVDSYSPCQMKIRGETPEWDKCPLNKGEDLSILDNRLVVFPDEFWPKWAESWKGITFGKWRKYIMDEKTERPR